MRTTRRSVHRIAAIAAGATLTLTGLVAVQAPAQAATDPAPLAVGTAWLKSQLTSGLIHNTQYGGFDDYGLTIDVGLALNSLGTEGATVSQIADALESKIANGYAENDEYAFTPPYDLVQRGHYAGATAKSLVFAQAVGEDPTTWSGTDLVAATEARVSSTAPIAGRIVDDSSYGDYANVLGQAYAAGGLLEAGSAKAGSVLDFLALQQCSPGYFRTYMTADKTATDQTCQGGRAVGASDPDTDATAIAVLRLLPFVDTNAKAARIVGRAESWLLAQQRADGSYGGGTLTGGSNTNSTGVAGWALQELGHSTAAAKAATWIRGHQANDLPTCRTGLAGETGAIAYDTAGLKAGQAEGIAEVSRDQWRRASAQALPVLAQAPTGTAALGLSGPGGFLKAQSSATYRVTGVVPGDQVCVRVGSQQAVAAAGLDGTVNVPLALPAGTATRTVSAVDRNGTTRTVTTRVLGATTLKVKPAKKRIKARTRVQVTVTGLVPGENVVLRLRAKKVAAGKADANGAFKARFNVGKKRGKAVLRATGEFPALRKGATTVRIVKRR